MQQAVLKQFPKADISVSIVWIDMLPGDNLEVAQRMARMFDDPRVRQFHDPRSSQRAGKALARGIIREGAGPAWDVYLFYGKDAEWSDAPPEPIEWCHQLGGGKRADPARYAGGKIAPTLFQIMHRLTEKPETPEKKEGN